MKPNSKLTEEELASIAEITGIDRVLLVGPRADHARAAQIAVVKLRDLAPPHSTLLNAAMGQMREVDQLRTAAFSVSLAREAKKLRDQISSWEMDPHTLFIQLAHWLTAKDLDTSYDFVAEEHTGPALRAALRLSERGFQKLCKRAKARGKRRSGKATLFSRRDVVQILTARVAPMSAARREGFIAALGAGIKASVPFQVQTGSPKASYPSPIGLGELVFGRRSITVSR